VVAQLVEVICYTPECGGFDLEFLKTFPPKIALTSTQLVMENEYQVFLLKSESDRCVRLITLPRSYANCLEILGDSISWSRKV
jgi:hypothetical protein